MICLRSFINYRRPVDPILRFFFPLLEFFFFSLDPILEEQSIFLEIANHPSDRGIILYSNANFSFLLSAWKRINPLSRIHIEIYTFHETIQI